MSLLAPLGLLGLLGIVALIIIYIIKPNYQNKFISSTYIWKLSLKYKRKKIPLNKLRNILLFLCQVAIIAAAAYILARPFIINETKEAGDEIIIIDASASMHTQTSQQTRIERAAESALANAKKALDEGKKVSIILASDKASFLVQQASSDQADLVYDAIDTLTYSFEDVYTYGSPDIDGAIDLAEQITSYAKNSSVTLYTDTNYLDVGEVKVQNVSDSSEWNAAILDVRATLVENNYRIEIDVASYAADARIPVICEIFNVNGTGTNMEITYDAYCSNDEITTIVFGHVSEDMSEAEQELINEDISVFSYETIYVHLSEYDSLSYDNQFYLYGGKKPVVNVLYYSSQPNNYWTSALLVLEALVQERWDVEITEATENELQTEGFDIYIFEHTMPTTLPSDGIVILSNPTKLPNEAGIRFGSSMTASDEVFLSPTDAHKIMNNIDPTRISVTKFTEIKSYDGYLPLASYEDYPLILLKDDVDQKILLMPFSLHFSNLAVLPDFPLILNNLLGYFFPLTTEEFVFEVGDSIPLNSMAGALEMVGPGLDESLDSFPAEVTVVNPGSYTMTQYPMSGIALIDSIYVRIPNSESAINHTEDILKNPYFYEEIGSTNIDLLFYFALAMVSLLFIEWWLKSREQI